VTDESGDDEGDDEESEDNEPIEVDGVTEDDIRVLTGEELLDLFRAMCPSIDETGLDKAGRPRRPTVGLVCDRWRLYLVLLLVSLAFAY
jgi:hypothetical protein